VAQIQKSACRYNSHMRLKKQHLLTF